MDITPKQIGKQRFTKPYQWLIVSIGALIIFYAAFDLPIERIDLRFLLLATMTVITSWRVAVQIPRVNTNVTVSDTFIFLALLLYGGEAGILLAAVEGTCSGLRISRKPLTILFSSAVMACSTFLTVLVLRVYFGSIIVMSHAGFSSTFVMAMCTMALVQYIANTGIVAVGLACKANQPIWHTWTKHYLWTSITYFVGAAAAGTIFNFVGTTGFYAFAFTIPIVLTVYFTYNKYLEDIKATAAQAEQAERERAEQAERHVEELNRHIAEQERISQALQESKDHFRHAAFHDALTGLPNRSLLADHLQLAIERVKGHKDHLFAALFLDIDRFKNINDSLGHIAGDQLLVTIARRLEECLRPMDTVARLGGDEFAILLDGLDDYSDAMRVAERVQQAIMRPFNLNGHEVYTTASIGITLSTTGYNDPENILRDADTAMYRAKENGKARHELFDTAMHARAVALLQLENDLRRAIERQEFCIYYQPIIALETNTLAGFEALVRWHHPERGFVSPSEFIGVAEETGLIVDIGQWVLRESCRQMRQWQGQFPASRPLIISVNLSGKQFTQPDLIEQIKQILQETGLDAHSLKLEITESVVMENAETASTMLMQLRALGAHLSIDDFGTGYSSLSYLHRFPVNTLKIDRSFINRMSASGENSEIVRAIITLAFNLGMEVIAEGVETEAQLSQLKALNCDYGQGYLFSRPVDAETARTIVAANYSAPLTVPCLMGETFVTADTDSSHIN